MRANLNRRDFTASLLAAATLPHAAFAQATPITRRFGVFSLFHPQQLLIQSTQPTLLHLNNTLHMVPPQSSAIRIQITPNHRLTITFNNSTHTADTLRITNPSGEATTFTLTVPPPSLHGTIQRQYTATLDLYATEAALQPILTMDIETATASIVLAESPAHAPAPYLQAQAIISRSFLLSATTGHRNFDFCDTTHCQFLREAPPPNSPAAIATTQTTSQHLTYEGQILPAMYSRSCGGHTHTLAELGLPTHAYPYYSVSCQPCLQHPERWHSTITPDTQLPTNERTRLALTRIQGWSALPSNTFSRTSNNIEGVGLGHGIGLCQRGAVSMAIQGIDHPTILAHYYPNTILS